jgi:NAD(P)-dependent dehydrogenase (short-subunit alcohol dehydrogenase family)
MGRSHAVALASRGARVVVNDLGSATAGGGSSLVPADAVVQEIESAGGVATADYNDIAKEEGGAALIAAAVRAYGRVDIVVNNAGIFEIVPFPELTGAAFDRMMKVNAYGPFHVLRAAWPYLLESGHGRVVNVSSAAGLYGYTGRAHYATSKAALVGLSRTLAIEGAERGVRVNVLIPSAFTRMTSKGVRDAMAKAAALPADGDGIDSLMERSAAQVSAAVVWLSHEACEWNGEMIHAGRGRIARAFIGLTDGYRHGDTVAIEEIHDHLEDIVAEDGYSVPGPWTPSSVVNDDHSPAATGDR